MLKFRHIFVVTLFLSLRLLQAGEHFTNLQTGYLDGFFVQTEDGNYRLKVGARVDFGYLYAFRESANELSTFDILHAKLYFGGNAYSPNLPYYVQFAAGRHQRPFLLSSPSETGNNGLVLEDAYARAIWNDWTLMGGQFKVPFGKQWMIYSGNLEFTDRSIATNMFHFGRDRGVTLTNKTNIAEITLGFFNGGGSPFLDSGLRPGKLFSTGQNASNDATPGSGHLYVARVSTEVGGPTGYSEGDVEQSEGNRLELGSSFVFDHNRDLDLNGDGSVDDTHANALSVSADLTWKLMGRSLQSEFFFRHLTGPATINSNAYGVYIQPGFFLTPNALQLVGRFGWIDPNDKIANDQFYEAGGAINYYLTGDHRIKTQVQYLWRAQEVNVKKFDNHLLELLFQLTI